MLNFLGIVEARSSEHNIKDQGEVKEQSGRSYCLGFFCGFFPMNHSALHADLK